jgi:hypothetical protein
MPLAEILGIIAAVMIIGAVALLRRVQRVRRLDLGAVSDHWVTEHRADRPAD